MNATYRVVISGLQEGFSKDQVNNNLAGLFKTTVEKLPDIFGQSTYVVKKNLDLETAKKYQALIQKQGCGCLVESEAVVELTLDEASLPIHNNADEPHVQPKTISETGFPEPSQHEIEHKFCHSCGIQLPITTKFCFSCGASVNLDKIVITENQVLFKDTPTTTVETQNNLSKNPKQSSTLTFIVTVIVIAIVFVIPIGLGGYKSYSDNRAVVNNSIATDSSPVPEAPVKAHTPEPIASSPTEKTYRGRDLTEKYANELADILAKNPQPACQNYASVVRRLGSSGIPENIRERQIDSLNIPDYCAQ